MNMSRFNPESESLVAACGFTSVEQVAAINTTTIMQLLTKEASDRKFNELTEEQQIALAVLLIPNIPGITTPLMDSFCECIMYYFTKPSIAVTSFIGQVLADDDALHRIL